MRLHHLEMTAFGPFAGTVEVDFDELSAGGLFLLTGATGAGKTSVLDAVCFALYGQVPGDRAGARHLRSDHAAPGVAPEVVLRVSIGDRTFRFTRSPAWSRPKLRGSGEARIQAHVLVEQDRADGWVPLTNRLDEAGHLVSELLGMTATQFTQVAMLPQGRFQAFLRASSTERHAVLQKLFRTDRFEQVERHLVDLRTAARRDSEAAEQRVVEVLNRLQEAATAELPEEWADDLTIAADRGDLAAWSAGLVAEAEAARAAAAHAHTAAADGLRDADQALEDGRALHDLQQRAEGAARELVQLTARADELAELRGRLDGHRRAAPLAPLVARAEECRQRRSAARTRWLAHHAVLLELGLTEPPTRTLLAAQRRDAVKALSVAESFRPRADDLARARERHAALDHQLIALDEALAALEAALAEHPADLTAAEAAHEAAQTAVTELPAREQEVATLDELLGTAHRLEVVTAELDDARADLVAATASAQAARSAYLDVREARINGMAAELAGALAVGCACPVCGSAAHPAPARAGGTTIGRAQEDAARRAHEDAAFVQQACEVRVAALTTEIEGLTARLGSVDRRTLPDRLDTARSTLDATRALAAEATTRGAALRALKQRNAVAAEARGRTMVERAAVRQERDATAAAIAALATELDALLDDDSPDLDALIARRRDRSSAIDAAADAFADLDEATRSASEAADAVHRAASLAGFDTPDEATGALLTDDRAAAVEDTLATAEATRLAAEQALADPATRAAADRPAPDLDVLRVLQRLAAENAQTTASGLDAATTRERRLAALHQELGARLDAWTPLREQHTLVAGLAQLVEGKGPDNPMKIRLAAYVLSERLRQVVAAANERLARMTGQRYSLEHTDDRGAGELRGGLSLLVRDDWNGVPRDPATLSGGETFVVSLALALGLADTVAHEAGGTDIDTLFIDEGFGSLDSETLEDVMDTLDSLRDGGRVVGLVSHVPELRSRITSQLEVRKHRTGSTLRPVLSGG